MEPFSFASSEAVEIPVNIRMLVLCANSLAIGLTMSQSQPRRRTNADPLLYPYQQAGFEAYRVELEVPQVSQ
jgi:hypothetical protein